MGFRRICTFHRRRWPSSVASGRRSRPRRRCPRPSRRVDLPTRLLEKKKSPIAVCDACAQPPAAVAAWPYLTHIRVCHPGDALKKAARLLSHKATYYRYSSKIFRVALWYEAVYYRDLLAVRRDSSSVKIYQRFYVSLVCNVYRLARRSRDCYRWQAQLSPSTTDRVDKHLFSRRRIRGRHLAGVGHVSGSKPKKDSELLYDIFSSSSEFFGFD
ncbi:unnamed protein product [Trichogramma brassicae]|uniref:Uncharacterized protein n=1 Tax=Trichogramma brassicae TaxID=86971 RepID=A0A6H5HY53_9HYME|nr:unnamed protein product [Trichogramma brassicae]